MFRALSTSFVSFHWTSPPVPTPDCTTIYTVQVNLTDTDTTVLTKEIDELAVNVSSLMMNTNYSYRVAGSDNAGRMGEWSDKQCFYLKGTKQMLVTMYIYILYIVPEPLNILPINISDYQDEELTVKWKVRAYLEYV